MENIVTYVRKRFFNGSKVEAARAFKVTPEAFFRWEHKYGEFPAKSGRMQQAHELTGLDYKQLAPSIFRSPV